MRDAFLLIGYVAISVSGLTLLKSALPNLVSVKFLIGFFLYGLGFLMWLYVLSRIPLSVAFPVAAGGLITASLLTGIFFLGEAVTPFKVIGVVLIVTGVVVIYWTGNANA